LSAQEILPLLKGPLGTKISKHNQTLYQPCVPVIVTFINKEIEALIFKNFLLLCPNHFLKIHQKFKAHLLAQFCVSGTGFSLCWHAFVFVSVFFFTF
jgi:hypothetical protein